MHSVRFFYKYPRSYYGVKMDNKKSSPRDEPKLIISFEHLKILLLVQGILRLHCVNVLAFHRFGK